MSRGRGVNSASSLWLGLLTWCYLWYCCLSPVAATSTDHPPRAVLVSFALENDLPAVLSSVSQLEETFNSRYRYDWVFFSTHPLSEDFRRLTSNATKATCVYEVICNELWSVPRGASDSTPQPAESDMEPESYEAAALVRRWKSGRFARESRLKSYDWFWTIEPGAQFIHDINFDVFRVMRDHNIAYGSHQGGLDDSYMRRLSQHAKSFMDENPGLAYEEADFSWLLESAVGRDGAAHDSSAEEAVEMGALDDETTLDCTAAADEWLEDGGDEDGVGSPVEVLASSLGSIYRSSLWPTFEVGSLAFLRSQSHQALLEHLDKVDNSDALLCNGGTPTLSASILVPQKSVLHFRKREKRHAQGPSLPVSTPKPQFSLVRIVGDGLAGNRSSFRRLSAMTAERWELMAHDFCRQGVMPGLRSGHTVIDERNFVLNASKREVAIM
ncbi:hypothetical protein XA68_17543 [Ophiocordyceps unilateralis]|uniref:Alpha-1,2 mannosyltransferase KTR1 n=1 Tax=Ophiocordyceps unilateralis TaxID=268505 RepID=A0A2A9PIP4_OPHUN|nr:hypothetical protein XA68_17543 [Ophiocordyceps unilateralis]